MTHPIPPTLRLSRSLGRCSPGRLALGGIAVLIAITAISPSSTADPQAFAPVLAASGPQIYLPILGNQWPVGLREVGRAGGSSGPMVIAGRHAYIAEGRQVNVYAIDGPGSPRQVGTSPRLPADVRDLTPQGPYLFVKTGGNFLDPGGTYEVFDIGDDAAKDPLRGAGRAEALRGINDITFHGETGYICDSDGVRAMDARDPLHMVELGALPVTDGVTECQRSDSGVLMVRCVRKCGNPDAVASNGSMWRAIDVRDPAAMRVISSIGDDNRPELGGMSGYLLTGNRLYTEDVSRSTGRGHGLSLIDISDPLAWRELGSLGLRFWSDCYGSFAADGTRIYAGGRGTFAAGGRSTCVYDWSDAAAPTPRLAATLAVRPEMIAAQDDRLVVVNEDLNVFGVADLDALRARGSVGLVGEPTRVAGRGRTLVTLSERRVSQIDVSLPSAPRVIASWDAALRYDGEFILPSIEHTLPPHRLPIYDGQDLNVLDLDHPSSPLRSTSIRLFDMPAPGVVASQDRLAVVASEGRLRVGVTVTAAIVVVQHDLPEGPRVIGRIDLTQVQSFNPDIQFTSGRIVGARAYFTTIRPPKLVIVDLAQPSTPLVLNWVPLTGDPAAVAVQDGVAYVAVGEAGLHIVSIAVPADAAEVAVVAAGKAVDVIDAAAPGGSAVLYVADADGALRVFDLADPLAPRQIDVIPVNGVPWSVTASEGGASDVWVAAQSGGVVGFAWR